MLKTIAIEKQANLLYVAKLIRLVRAVIKVSVLAPVQKIAQRDVLKKLLAERIDNTIISH